MVLKTSMSGPIPTPASNLYSCKYKGLRGIEYLSIRPARMPFDTRFDTRPNPGVLNDWESV